MDMSDGTGDDGLGEEEVLQATQPQTQPKEKAPKTKKKIVPTSVAPKESTVTVSATPMTMTTQVVHPVTAAATGAGTGKGKGKGKGKVAAGNKRHKDKKSPWHRTNPLTRPAIRRLARRGGVKRLSKGIYDETEGAPAQLREYLEKLIKAAVTFTDHQRRKTVSFKDVKLACAFIGTPLYM